MPAPNYYPRGTVVATDIDFGEGPKEKYFVVVSGNQRNKNLEDFIVARITSSNKPEIPSIIDVPDDECVSGKVLCDDLYVFYKDEVKRTLGSFSPRTMSRVSAGLTVALDL